MSHSASLKRTDEQSFNGEWVRETASAENMLDCFNRQGGLLTWYQLNLKSQSLLQEEQVKTALSHMYRKCPNLGLCIGVRDGKSWFRKAMNPEIDFKVLHCKSLSEVRTSLQKHKHNFESGPMFCARLLLNPSVEETYPDDEDPDMQHRSYMFFSFAHSITDGSSSMHLMGFFLSLLNDVILQKPINDEEPLGVHVSPEQHQKLVKEKKNVIEASPELREQLTREEENFGALIPYIVKISGSLNEEMDTATLCKIFGGDTTSAFIEKCRENKVTLNSGLAAIMNAALIDLLIEEGVIQDSYKIQTYHMVNVRRYWETQIEQSLGLHSGYPMNIHKITPRDVDNQFWDYARSLHQDIKSAAENGKPMINEAFATLVNKELPITVDYLLGPKKYFDDYICSNLGDVTSKVTDAGQHVRATHVLRSSTMHLTEHPLQVGCHTFRGKFTMIFSYNKAAIRKDIIERFSDFIFQRIENI